MPILDPQQFLRNHLNSGTLPSVLIFRGNELWKQRELRQKISDHLGLIPEERSQWERSLEGGDCTEADIIREAQSILFGQKTLLLRVRNAQEIAWSQSLIHLIQTDAVDACLFAKPREIALWPEPRTLLILEFATWNARKKISTELEQTIISLPTEPVPEKDRAKWIQYLARREQCVLSEEAIHSLSLREPFSLEEIQYHLRTNGESSPYPDRAASEEAPATDARGTLEAMVARFLNPSAGPSLARDPKLLHRNVEQGTDFFPVLGLIEWNARQALLRLHQAPTPSFFERTYRESNLDRVPRAQAIHHVTKLLNCIADFDVDLKSSQSHPWSRFLWNLQNPEY